MSFDFLKHCETCPSHSTHCCTKEDNVVLIRDEEKENIRNLFTKLVGELNIQNDDYKLFNESENLPGVTLLNLIRDVDPSGQGTIDRCPFFVKPYCKIHTLGKPLDCKLWPVSRFENNESNLVHVDYNCSALKSSDKIPVSSVDESIKLFQTLTDDQKQVYYEQSRKHYHLAPIPINRWDKLQEYFTYKSHISNNCEHRFKKFSKKYVDVFYNTKAVIMVSKWIIGIFFVMILSSMFNLVANNVSNYSQNEIPFLSLLSQGERLFILLFFPIIFLLDAYRIIVPLPWITKYIDEKSQQIEELKNDPNNLPKFQLSKLIVIGLLSFCTGSPKSGIIG